MKIAIVDLGYVGLLSAILIAQKNEVTVVDISQVHVDMLNEGHCTIEDREMAE